jgi:hypothetical protein
MINSLEVGFVAAFLVVSGLYVAWKNTGDDTEIISVGMPVTKSVLKSINGFNLKKILAGAGATAGVVAFTASAVRDFVFV